MIDQDSNIRAATLSDLQEIVLLLEEVNLPSEDISHHLNNFLVWFDDSLRGCIGLEINDDNALLRSAAVRSDSQGKGIGKKLTRAIIAYARLCGVKNLYLLTTTAEKFFQKEGFVVINRDDVPESIKATTEFSHLCPDTAICMYFDLSQ
ncbi:MAG: GNAT family N-acetyltransferase [Asgard group archaeon]|nr:GNAT family N-acetyltransferase [Asgard group archaeon]